jgi:hypothetical protein
VPGTLVVTDPAACPDCGDELRTLTVGQLPLVRHAGHGAQLRTRTRWCRCGYRLVVDRSEVRP